MKLLFFGLVVISVTNVFAKDPDWIHDLKKGCRVTELCAIGTGESRNQAERNARVSLSKILDSRIDSKFTTSLEARGNKTVEEVSEEISESTKSALSGLQIQKFHENKTGFYAFAVINKAKAAAGLKKEIESFDNQLTAIFKEGKGLEKVKLEELYIKREVLNRQYSFLTSRNIPSPVSYDDIFQAKNAATNSGIVHIFLEEDEPKAIESLLKKLISDNGFKTTSGKKINPKATHVISGKYVANKEYLNVDGFEKYKFFLQLKAMKNAGKTESGHLNFETIGTGRDYSQIYTNAHSQIEEFLKTNVSKLNLE